jgi:hypothetical protein
VLFASNDCAVPAEPPTDPTAAPADSNDLTLERNEAIALVNLLARFSNSLHLYHELQDKLQGMEGGTPALQETESVA